MSWMGYAYDTPCTSKTAGNHRRHFSRVLRDLRARPSCCYQKVNARLGRHFVLNAAKPGLSA